MKRTYVVVLCVALSAAILVLCAACGQNVNQHRDEIATGDDQESSREEIGSTEVARASDGAPSLTVVQAIKAFENAGLECLEPTPISTSDSSPVPKTFSEGVRCVVPSVSPDHGFRIFSFSSEDNLQMVKDYYEAFTGFLGSYVYVKENLLFQTSVSMPVELVEEYQRVFESLPVPEN